MKNKFFDTLVKKVGKMRHKLLDMNYMKQVITDIMESEFSEKKMYKLLYYLKNRGYLLTLKKQYFFVKDPDEVCQEEKLLDRYYWTMLKKHCKEFVYSDWYIGGLKALELHMQSYDIPDDILVVTANKQATEVVMFDKRVVFKMYEHRKIPLFSHFKKMIVKVPVQSFSLPVACFELSLLETLFNPSPLSLGYIHGLVKKFLRKYRKYIRLEVFETILKLNKHHTSINRLYNIAYDVDPTLADALKTLIKKYSYFID